MATVINPHIALLIKGASDWWSEDEPTRLDMSIDITKDLDEEPNEAVVEIYNLTADTRSRIIDPSVRDTPIEIHYAAFGSDVLTKCYVGEIESARSRATRPGMVTRLVCKSQQTHMRAKYIDKKTFDKGTLATDVIGELTSMIGLPVQLDDTAMPVVPLSLAATFSGPAFQALRKFVFNYGLFAYITDGTLHISGVYAPPNPSLIQITKNTMVTLPEPMERKDSVDVVMHTITDTNGINPFAKKTRRNKRKWTTDALTRTDYVEYDAIDDIIMGVECETLGTPMINPDNIVQFEDDPANYRVQVVNHRGDTRDGITTTIQADVFDGDAVFGGLFGPGI